MLNEPPYRRIMRALRDEIASGALKPGARVPSEHQLVEAFSVSRMTANRALRELAQEGLIQRSAGIGSFVAEQRVEVSLLVVPDIAEDIKRLGGEYGARIIERGAITPAAEVSAALETRPDQPVFHSLIVHACDGQPMQLEDRFVNPGFAPDYLMQDFTDRTPNAYLTAIGRVEEAEQIVEAIAADARLAGLLDIARHAPCLKVTRRTWADGMVATFVRLISPGQRWQMRARFRP